MISIQQRIASRLLLVIRLKFIKSMSDRTFSVLKCLIPGVKGRTEVMRSATCIVVHPISSIRVSCLRNFKRKTNNHMRVEVSLFFNYYFFFVICSSLIG